MISKTADEAWAGWPGNNTSMRIGTPHGEMRREGQYCTYIAAIVEFTKYMPFVPSCPEAIEAELLALSLCLLNFRM
jgi:hypothetical protein